MGSLPLTWWPENNKNHAILLGERKVVEMWKGDIITGLKKGLGSSQLHKLRPSHVFFF